MSEDRLTMSDRGDSFTAELLAWDRFAAAALRTMMPSTEQANRAAAVADEMIRLRRQRYQEPFNEIPCP